MNQRDDAPAGVPGAEWSSGTDGLLRAVEDDTELLDGLNTVDQVPVFDRMHAALADALARTTDNEGAPPSADPVA
jgi:hypothetical protein